MPFAYISCLSLILLQAYISCVSVYIIVMQTLTGDKKWEENIGGKTGIVTAIFPWNAKMSHGKESGSQRR